MNLRKMLLAPLCLLATIFNTQPVIAAINHTLGDMDGFGMGLGPGDYLPTSDPRFDNRDSSDPSFTDTWSVPPVFSYTHSFSAPREQITGASLTLFSLGIQDGDSQVVGSDMELLLFLDGVEIKNAFDSVDQFDFFPGVGFRDFAGIVEISIPASFFPLLQDGVAEFSYESFDNLRPNAFEGFAIDYSQLYIETVPAHPTIPTLPPTGLVLLALLMTALAFRHLRKI